MNLENGPQKAYNNPKQKKHVTYEAIHTLQNQQSLLAHISCSTFQLPHCGLSARKIVNLQETEKKSKHLM
jgi:hypothetical protein